MAPQQASRAQSGSSRTPHHPAEPNLQGETRVHRRYFNGLLGLAAWTGIVGPAGIPPSILGRLRTVFGEAMKGEQVQQALRKLFVVPDARSGQEFGEFIRESNHEWGRAIAKAKIAPQ